MTDPKVRTESPRQFLEIENTWIPMPDGKRLAARIWLPEDAEDDPVPAILEYLPYRKRDGTVERDQLTHPYFAGFGYAGVRVDMRGTGDSEGICLGEYLQQEQDDALAVIDWLAKQSWCTGKVGMIGISWGGFNGLQVAARQPDALGAVISLCSTDDRYTDDIHFMGGAMLTDKLAWGGTAFPIVNTPPDPAIVGARWRDMWLERLENNGLWFLDWVKHQRRDDFYAHGSICEDWDAIKVPIYAVGGYADGYTNPIFRMMEHLKAPRKALIGPWAHKYPHFATPEPRIGFLQECLRWWDQHLKGVDTGIMDEPMIRAWVQDAAPPSPHTVARPGHWISMAQSVDEGVNQKAIYLTDQGLSFTPGSMEEPIEISSPETAGWTAPTWCIYGVNADGALDQNGEAGLVTAFESPALDEDIQIFGFPHFKGSVQSLTAQANLTVVLSMVAPDGQARMITYGILNLTHRDGHSAPESMPDGQPVDVDVQLNVIGQTIPAGYKLRVALSSAFWPLIWPSAQKARLVLAPGDVVLSLPILDTARQQPALMPFEQAESAPPLDVEELAVGSYTRTRTLDLASGFETTVKTSDYGRYKHMNTGMIVGQHNLDTFSIHPDEPNTAQMSSIWNMSFERDAWRAELNTTVTMRASANTWHVTAQIEARDQDGLVATRNWDEQIPRDMV